MFRAFSFHGLALCNDMNAIIARRRTFVFGVSSGKSGMDSTSSIPNESVPSLASDHRMIDLTRDSLFRHLPQRRVINRWI